MRKQISILCSLALGLFANAQNVNIPDVNFKNALLAHGGTITGPSISVIDTNGDGEISVTEAQAYTGHMEVGNQNISNLTGLESFINVSRLNCEYNNLTTLDVSANNQLTYINCRHNQLTDLNIGNNVVLDFIAANNNQLTSLDTSSNTSLITVYLSTNQLTSLNVANGNNSNLYMLVYADANPNLSCIQVDAGFTPPINPNYWRKDAAASYNSNCPNLSTVDIDREAASIMIYPNPASAMVHVEWKEEGIEQVDILDASGRKVLSQQVTGKKATIAVDRLASGIYFVKTGNTTQKLIVE